jgi:hypothetical protein
MPIGHVLPGSHPRFIDPSGFLTSLYGNFRSYKKAMKLYEIVKSLNVT